MNKHAKPLHYILLIMIFPMWYGISWNIGFDAADWSWPYSLYHFLDAKSQIFLVLYVLVVVVMLILIRDKSIGKRRFFLSLATISLVLFLVIQLAQLFFSLHTLANGGSYLSISSQYNPLLINSVLGMFVKFASLTGSLICLIISDLITEKN